MIIIYNIDDKKIDKLLTRRKIKNGRKIVKGRSRRTEITGIRT